MSSVFRFGTLVLVLSGFGGTSLPPLRFCLDPNNLPFSNDRGEGFENAIAEIVAHDMGRTAEYFWMPQRRGFVRRTLQAGACDVIVGTAAASSMLLTTKPYYRSTYVFVSRHDRRLGVQSLDDEALRRLRIGIQVTGEDYDNPPAAQALARRRLAANVRGYTVYGDYSQSDPQRAIVDAVAKGDVDVAIVWGPLAGFYAKHAETPLELVPVSPALDGPALPFVFDIAMGVRKDDVELRTALDRAIVHQRARIHRILATYGVPDCELSAVGCQLSASDG